MSSITHDWPLLAGSRTADVKRAAKTRKVELCPVVYVRLPCVSTRLDKYLFKRKQVKNTVYENLLPDIT